MTKQRRPAMAFRRLRKKHIHITLWHNDEISDWSICINGQLHDHITSDLLEAVVESQLLVAEQLLATTSIA